MENEMARQIFRFAWIFVIAFHSTTACAYFTQPELIPEHPRAGEPVSFAITSGFCDILAGTIDIERVGTVVRAVVDGVRTDGICGFPAHDYIFDMGEFSAGLYTLQVDFSYYYFAGPPDDINVETIAVIPFNVSPATGAVAMPVPASDLGGLAGLAFLLVALSVAVLRQRPR
jgi:hypothetical protein